jgi:hypothetical protein
MQTDTARTAQGKSCCRQAVAEATLSRHTILERQIVVEAAFAEGNVF